jgi:hypothetical protein
VVFPPRVNRRRSSLSTALRGYGGYHQRLKAVVAQIVLRGEATCARCGLPIAAGEPWDLGHDDFDRRKYSGPEHRACNRATASHRRKRVSRSW